jgi:forespore regulator of the sigma-K checkpoint
MDMGIKKKLEKLKRQILRKRGWMLASFVVVLIAALFMTQKSDPESKIDEERFGVPIPAASIGRHGGGELVLHKLYVCGDQYESLGYYNDEEIEQLVSKHPDWKLEGIDGDERVIYAVEVEDLSPDCRRNAYFGLDSNNSLTLYDGKPSEGKVIRTFFQVDIEHLRNSLPQETVTELHEGIKISDFAEFNSVLSTFSDYAVNEAEQVLKPMTS